MEKRKEYAEGEIITCPRCGGDDLDCEAPRQGTLSYLRTGVHHQASSRLGRISKP